MNRCILITIHELYNFSVLNGRPKCPHSEPGMDVKSMKTATKSDQQRRIEDDNEFRNWANEIRSCAPAPSAPTNFVK